MRIFNPEREIKGLAFRLKSLFKNWLSQTGGVTSLEYALIGSGIAMSIITAVFLFGNDLGDLYNELEAMQLM